MISREHFWIATSFFCVGCFIGSAFTSSPPDPVCIERDAAMAERSYAACVAAVTQRTSDVRACPGQAQQIACKTWSRP